MVSRGQADLIIGLEMLEGLRGSEFSGPKTNFLINKYSLPFMGGLKGEEIIKLLPKENLHLVPASEICKEKLQNEVVSGLYLLGYAIHKKLMPLDEKSVAEAINKIIPPKYQELNLKALKLPHENN